MASIVKLRWINLVGGLLFTVYGYLIGSIPVAFLNFGIVLINIYYLVQYYGSKESFKVINADMHSDLFNYFLETNREEIEKQISIEKLKRGEKSLYMLRDNNIAGILIGDQSGDELDIRLDYVTPRYRDFKLGEYYFLLHPEVFKEKGIKRLRAHANEDTHRSYLERMGFEKDSENPNDYIKIL
jgi:hypothetical protein